MEKTHKTKLSDLEVITYIIDNEYQILDLVAEFGLKTVLDHLIHFNLNQLYKYKKLVESYG